MTSITLHASVIHCRRVREIINRKQCCWYNSQFHLQIQNKLRDSEFIFNVFHFRMHLCRSNYQSYFHYVGAICYDWVPWVVPVLRGPWSVKIGVMAVVEPPPPTVLSGAVTTVPVIVSIQSTEQHTIQLCVRRTCVNHTVAWNGENNVKWCTSNWHIAHLQHNYCTSLKCNIQKIQIH